MRREDNMEPQGMDRHLQVKERELEHSLLTAPERPNTVEVLISDLNLQTYDTFSA